MSTDNKMKSAVKDRYTKIAESGKGSDCCGSSDSEEIVNIMRDSYDKIDGYNSEADLGLGCGIPTEFAGINKGDVVVDLGSGAGNDCFVARHDAGEEGMVYGIDFSESMLKKARSNAEKLSLNNVKFLQGDIDEKIPLDDETADVVLSNCVLNLIPNKKGVFEEMHRILKSGGHFSISDIVLQGDLPAQLKKDAELYAGCVSGAIQEKEYLQLIEDAGFSDLELLKKKEISLPKDLLRKHDEKTIQQLENDDFGIYSITVKAVKRN